MNGHVGSISANDKEWIYEFMWSIDSSKETNTHAHMHTHTHLLHRQRQFTLT